MTPPEPRMLRLDGCSPTPLAAYLKALGILRLISSPANHVAGRAADPYARGWWDNERFHLRTALSREGLERFFLDEYAPSPIIAPWNGRAGFLEGDEQEKSSTRAGAKLVRKFGASSTMRFANMRQTIECSHLNKEIAKLNCIRTEKKKLEKKLEAASQGEKKQELEQEKKQVEKKEKNSKQVLLPALRSATKPDHVSFVDACYVLATEQTPMPLLGSGGCDGSRDFGVNFAEALDKLFRVSDGLVTDLGKSSLSGALLGQGRGGVPDTMGQFSPGHGGSNATTGYQGVNPLNPWDVVLTIEGTIVFAGALTRSWGVAGGSRAAFPFTFEPIGAAAGIFSTEDPNRPRGEIWVPLWTKPTTFLEIAAIFSEGRLTLGHRAARSGLDAARAVAQIGLARGIGSFERFSLIQTDSKMPYQATPLGRIATPAHPRKDLIVELESRDWLRRAQRLAGNKKTSPSRARLAVRRLENSLFQMTDAARASQGARNALMAIGNLVDWLGTNRKAREELNPPPRLSQNWVREADDGTPEFRIAAALAGVGLPTPTRATRKATLGSVGLSAADSVAATLGDSAGPLADEDNVIRAPMAAHFAPINDKRFFHGKGLARDRSWADTDTSATAVWSAGGLVSNMIAILERRLVEATMRGVEDKPLAAATWARAEDIASFLFADFDDNRCASLLRGLVWATPATLRSPTPRTDSRLPRSALPFAYAALKPLFSTNAALRRVGAIDGMTRIPVPPGLLASLRAAGSSTDGRAINGAVNTALGRARGSGLRSPFDAPAMRRGTSSRIGAGIRADRLAASLLIPIGDGRLDALINLAYSLASTDGVNPKEDINDVN